MPQPHAWGLSSSSCCVLVTKLAFTCSVTCSKESSATPLFSNVLLKIQAMAQTVTGLKEYIEQLQQQIQDARCQKAWKSVFGGSVFQQWLKPMVVSKHACAIWNNMAYACALFQIAHACFEKTIDFNHSWNTLPPKTNVQALWQNVWGYLRAEHCDLLAATG